MSSTYYCPACERVTAHVDGLMGGLSPCEECGVVLYCPWNLPQTRIVPAPDRYVLATAGGANDSPPLPANVPTPDVVAIDPKRVTHRVGPDRALVEAVRTFTAHFKHYEHSPGVWLIDAVSDWTDDEIADMIRALPL